MIALSPHNEAQRLSRLKDLLVLDSPPEPVFDNIAKLASEVCGTPIALLSLVDEERQWFKANVGLAGVNETPRDVAFCAHAIADEAPSFEVPDARLDARFADNPLVTGEPDIRFYAGIPLAMPDGCRIGTLCVIDREPRTLNTMQTRILGELATIATQALALRRDLIVRALSIRSEDEKAIAASEARYRDLVEQQRELVSLARPDGTLAYVNPAYARHFGRTTEELIGLNLFDYVDVADEAGVRERFRKVLAGEGGQDDTNRNVGGDGQARWVAWTNTLQQDAEGQPVIHSVGRDVTEQRLMEARLAEAALDLQKLASEQSAMLDNEIVGMVRLRGRVAVWKNRALELMFGYEPDELLGQSSRVLYPDDASYETMGRAAIPAINTSGRYRAQLQMRHKAGHLIWIDTSGVLLSAESGETMWVMVDVTQMKEHQMQVEHIAFHDSLTRLPNRLLLADRMQQAIALADRLDRRMAVCFLDLDGFKAVNDQHGHAAGDQLLIEAAKRLQTCVRQTDTVARLGGDEFVVLLTPVDGAEACAVVLDRITRALREPFALPQSAAAQISVSIGAALYPDDATQANLLMGQADAALYEAKRAGKNRVRFSAATSRLNAA